MIIQRGMNVVRNTRRTDPAMGSVPEVGGRGGGRRRLPGPRTTPSGPAETCAPHGDRAGELSSGGCHSAGKKIVLAAGDIRTLSANGGWNSTESPDGFPCQAPESLLGLQITPLSKTRQTGNVMLTKGGFNKAVSAEATILWGAVANYPLVQFRLLVNQILNKNQKKKYLTNTIKLLWCLKQSQGFGSVFQKNIVPEICHWHWV